MENSFAKGYRASAEGREGMLPNETFTLMLNAEKLDNYYCYSLYNLRNDNYLPAKIQLIDIPNYSLSINLSGAEWLFYGADHTTYYPYSESISGIQGGTGSHHLNELSICRSS